MDALQALGTGEWRMKMTVPQTPPTNKICVPLLRGAHHSLLVIDGTKNQFTLLSSTSAKPRIINWTTWSDSTPRNVPKQYNGTDCGAFTICYGRIALRWERIPKQMNKNDVTANDISIARFNLG